jgi:hypothetical protein
VGRTRSPQLLLRLISLCLWPCGSLDDINALNAISAAPVHLSKAEALARKQAEAYADVYGITAENMNSFKEWW